MEKFRV